MEVQLNTLYVMTREASLRRDHLTLRVVVEKAVRLTVPIHQLDGVAVFGNVYVTPGAMQLCNENGVAVSFLTESGRMMARVDAPGSGNVLLRREQFRWADRPEKQAHIARHLVAGKVQNCRNVVLRGGREAEDEAVQKELTATADRLADVLRLLPETTAVDSIRGHEGNAANLYFEAFPKLIRTAGDGFVMKGRSRRPPRDNVNALLSFVYSLLLHDCVSALTAAGLDPSVGFLHVDRPGRPGLALDLMEEFRPHADRLVLALVNRRQVKPEGFVAGEEGAVQMDAATRRAVIGAYQQRKKEEVTHPLLDQKVPVGRLPFLQARILARHIRGDLEAYVPCVLKN